MEKIMKPKKEGAIHTLDQSLAVPKHDIIGLDGKPVKRKFKKLPPDDPDKKKLICIYVPLTMPFLYRKFFVNFLRIIHPSHFIKWREFGIYSYYTQIQTTFPLCKNRNEAVLKAKEHGADYMMFIDADMQHPPDIVYQLLKNQLPVVAGMYFHQSPPHLPIIYKHKEGINYTHYYDYPKDDLFSVDLTGMGCMLVDMKIFDHIELPYFGYRTSRDDGIIEGTEEVIFCEKIREAGFDVVIDPKIQCTHFAIEDVTQISFDSYMEEYKTGKALLEKFGDSPQYDSN
jgi:hypothetical protein